MKIIGLTGSLGSGKSFVASVFASLGAKVLDADRMAQGLLRRGTNEHKRIVAVFGKGVLDRRGRIVRRALAQITFSSKANTKRLNGIVHPKVIENINREIEARRGSCGALVIDAPLLIEAGLHRLVDVVVVVRAPRSAQLERCARKFGMSRKEALMRIRAQMPLEKKLKMADFVVDNDGTMPEIREKAKKVWRKIVWK